MNTSACFMLLHYQNRVCCVHCDCKATQFKLMQRDATTLEVTELPIRKWTQDYKEFLETLIKPEDKNAPALIEVMFVCTQPPPVQDITRRGVLYLMQELASAALAVSCYDLL